jgi:hypothetical protein
VANGTKEEHRVTIFKHGGVTRVWPPYVVVKAGDSVSFRAIGTSAMLVFPHAAAFNTAQMDPGEYEKPEVGSEILIRVGMDKPVQAVTQSSKDKMDLGGLRSRWQGSAVTADNCQIYAYSVFCGELNDLAQGQSSPVMIIEPPDDRP